MGVHTGDHFRGPPCRLTPSTYWQLYFWIIASNSASGALCLRREVEASSPRGCERTNFEETRDTCPRGLSCGSGRDRSASGNLLVTRPESSLDHRYGHRSFGRNTPGAPAEIRNTRPGAEHWPRLLSGRQLHLTGAIAFAFGAKRHRCPLAPDPFPKT